ncbi:MAG: VTT domain-containing protein [Proteobacteria bacterium]|nr:VTT domain-containing protein [Pseudomonadota bacterium]
MKSKTFKKILLLALIAGLVALFFVLGLQKYLTLEFIKDSRDKFQEMYTQRPFFVISHFLAVYIPAIALNLPGAAILGLGAGALFGALPGTLIISFASAIGATLACLLSRYLLRDWIQKKFSDRLERINNGIQKEGAFYLFSMRLIPVIPFFVINMAMGLTPMRLRTFYWVSQLGMLPGTFIYVNAGSQIARIDSLAGIISPGFIGALALLGLFPLMTRKLLNAFQNHFENVKTLAAPEASANCPEFARSEFAQALEGMKASCTDCEACKQQCAFLECYGTPKQLLESFDMSRDQAKAFECSLCNLCSAVCPEQLDPGHLFFLARKQAMANGRVDLSTYKGILAYEQKGSSPLFSWYGLPHGCDTVFFPGCTLPGTRPETTWKMFLHLQTLVPSLGIVLDCCTKISHDLGRQGHFDFMFSEMLSYLKKNHIKKVWVACPNCYKIFASHGKGLQVTTVYEIMDGHDLPAQAVGKGKLVVHDPCPLRLNTAAQTAVRSLVDRMGMAQTLMHHQGRQTLCCGEGGSVGCVRPDLAKTWGLVRQKEAKGSRMVTYCAGCAGFLNRVTPTLHLADLIFDTKKSLNGGPRVAAAPFTYFHRIRLKHRFKKTILPATQRVRNCDPKIPARQKKMQAPMHTA